MSTTFNPFPDVPPEIENAAQSGDLVVFVGAGISRLINCPSWDGFADKVLAQLVPAGINYHDLAQIQTISDPKKRLSIAKIVAKKKSIVIDYASIFRVQQSEGNVYSHLNTFRSSFVTTNYEKYLCPVSRSAQPDDTWRFFRRDQLLGSHLDDNGAVIHLHGCVDSPDSMIITTKDYLEHYSTPEVQDFLRNLFKRKTILFLGYGLEEIEVLEYILRRGGAEQASGVRVTRFMIQGFFNSEMSLYELLTDYYLDYFGTQLIGFPKDYKNYSQLTGILEVWAKQLRFGGLELADEAVEIRKEIRD